MRSLFQDGAALGRAPNYFIAVSKIQLQNDNQPNDKGHYASYHNEGNRTFNSEETTKTQLNHNHRKKMTNDTNHTQAERVSLCLNANGLFGPKPKPKPLTLAEKVAADVAAGLAARGVFDALATETNNRAKR